MYQIPNKDRIKMKLYPMMLAAYADYPKLSNAFPDDMTRLTAIELTIRYFGNFDLRYGAAFSTSEKMYDCMMLIPSSECDYSEKRLTKAKCYERKVAELFFGLSDDDRAKWKDIFDQMDKKEAEAGFPDEYIYIDFLSVIPEAQGQGRGTYLLEYAKEIAKKEKKPLILFTNTDRHISFYEKCGFKVFTEISLDEYGVKNTYMIWRIDG